MKNLILLLSFAGSMSLLNCRATSAPEFTGKTISFNSIDGLLITADLYAAKDPKAPYILLFHQAGFSRGEYREIAPKLNAMGFNCLAIDQRSGETVNGIDNETYHRAKEKDLPTAYADALQDLEATVKYARNELNASRIIIWGSSYSAALTFVVGAKHKGIVKGILSFSPGEYMKVGNRKIQDFAKLVTCPVFITSAKNEKSSWNDIYNSLPTDRKTSYLPTTNGFHGSKALWLEKKGHEGYWEAVRDFLNKFPRTH